MESDRERNLDPNRDPYRDPTMDPNRDPSLDPNGDPNYNPNAQPNLGGNRDVEQGDNYDQGMRQDRGMDDGQQPSGMDKLKGKMREGAGKLTGNEDMEAEGRMQQEGGNVGRQDQGWGPGTRGDGTDLDQ